MLEEQAFGVVVQDIDLVECGHPIADLSVILIIDGLFFTVFEGKYQFTSDLD